MRHVEATRDGDPIDLAMLENEVHPGEPFRREEAAGQNPTHRGTRESAARASAISPNKKETPVETHDTGASTQALPLAGVRTKKPRRLEMRSREGVGHGPRQGSYEEVPAREPRRPPSRGAPGPDRTARGAGEEQDPGARPETATDGRGNFSPFTLTRWRRRHHGRRPGEHTDSGLHVQLCGDVHLVELRHVRFTERCLMFDINDFDETLVGPWEWDVKRSPASVHLPNDRIEPLIARTAGRLFSGVLRCQGP